MTTIEQAYELPRPEDIRAMAFVVKLKDEESTSTTVRSLVDDYVVTPAVRKELPKILADMQEVQTRREEYGRFIHGSFGSGKSHFMTLLGLLLENDDVAWSKDDSLIHQLADQRDWLGQANLLVVRIHMLSTRGRDTGFDRVVYESFNGALRRRGKDPFLFLHVDGVLEEARREAEDYGDAFWNRMSEAGIVGGPDDFDEMASGPAEDREMLARSYLEYKGRDATTAGIDPNWGDGLQGIAAHAEAQGFGGVVFLVDELLLWLAEKSGREFIREINKLDVIVDHATGQRRVPLYVFGAIQRNIRDFFPDMTAEDHIHEHLEHHLKRFEFSKLQDVELRHIVKGRVLRPRNPEAVATAVKGLFETHSRILPALLQGSDTSYLEDVYPFHPALIEMLVDVTSLMQRERSALRLLYELLVLHYPDLPLGEFLPVGCAFDAIFPESGVESTRQAAMLQEVHRQYWQRLRLGMNQLFEEREQAGEPLSESRKKALDQLVKTVLLGEVSPRLRQSGLTIERLVQLNSVDVDGETYRGRLRSAEADLVKLHQKIPDLQVSGSGKTAQVRYMLGKVSLGEVLGRARSKVDNYNQRARVGFSVLRNLLGLDKDRKFADGSAMEGELKVQWRNTSRRGTLAIKNVRELEYKGFEGKRGSFRIVVDYPWDQPGHTVEEDRQRAQKARKSLGNQFTACWLPRHLTPDELDTCTELAAVRFLVSEEGQEDLLSNEGRHDREKILEQARTRETTLKHLLETILRSAYQQGEIFALTDGVDSRVPFPELDEDLKHFAIALLDRQFNAHPTFKAEPKRADLQVLLDWMVAASEAGAPVPYDQDTEKVLRNLGVPLELVDLGHVKARLRLDSRYIAEVLSQTDVSAVLWDTVAEHLQETYGFQPMICDLFLCFLCARGHRALNPTSGERLEVSIGMRQTTIRLQRGALVDPAGWSRLRELGQDLFSEKTSAHRSLQVQDQFAAALKQTAVARRTTLQAFHARLVQLGAGEEGRREEVKAAIGRLAPLAKDATDSHAVLTELLDQWPDDASDAVRAVVRTIDQRNEALGALDDHALGHLQQSRQHPELGEQVRSHLDVLAGLLAAPDAERPLTPQAVSQWNKTARELVRKMLAVPPPKPPDPPPTPPGTKKVSVLESEPVDLKDPDAVGALVGRIRSGLKDVPAGSVKIDVVVTWEEEA